MIIMFVTCSLPLYKHDIVQGVVKLPGILCFSSHHYRISIVLFLPPDSKHANAISNPEPAGEDGCKMEEEYYRGP